MNTITLRENTFEIVDVIPKDYSIWPINMEIAYIPLCKVIKGTHKIETDTLKAVKVEDVEGANAVTKAALWSRSTIKGMESYIKRYQNKNTPWINHKIDIMKKAIEVLKTVKYE